MGQLTSVATKGRFGLNRPFIIHSVDRMSYPRRKPTYRFGPVGPSRASALLSVAPRALPPFPLALSASPPDSRAGSQALARERQRGGRARGESRRRVMPQHTRRLLMSAPCPHGTEIRSGVGRVARRARLAAKPFSRPLPRLTLKAGHKAGLPTAPIAACGATKRRPSSPSPF